MARLTTGKGLDTEICERLGVDPQTVAEIRITLKPRDVVTITLYTYAKEDDLTYIITRVFEAKEFSETTV